jgi:hypothetical protein
MVALLLLVLGVGSASAQDSNYWTNQYGTRSILLNGLVVGGPVDLSTMYYNPGGLAMLENPDLVLTVKAFEFANVSLPDAGGRGVDLDDPRSSVLPTFVGGLVPFNFLGSDALAYSFFPRQGMRANIAGRRSTQVDILPPPGLENRFVEVRLEQDLDESWFGATWSKKLSPRVGIGVSPYVAVRSQRSRAQIVGQAMASDGSGAATITIRGFQFSNYRLLAKAGASFALEKVNLGLTLTTPGVKLFGSGDAGIDRYRVGQSSNGLGNLFTTGFEEGLSSEWKSPLSIGAGATVPMGSTTLYFTGEWYDQVDEFKVLDVGTVVDQVSGLPVPFEVVHQARSVTNGGIGLEHAFGPKFTGFASFSTDFSTADEGASDTALSNWDIYLVSAGTTFPVGKSEFTVGAGYAFGSHDAAPPFSLTGGSAAGDVGAIPELGVVHYSSIHLIFGFSI